MAEWPWGGGERPSPKTAATSSILLQRVPISAFIGWFARPATKTRKGESSSRTRSFDPRHRHSTSILPRDPAASEGSRAVLDPVFGSPQSPARYIKVALYCEELQLCVLNSDDKDEKRRQHDYHSEIICVSHVSPNPNPNNDINLPPQTKCQKILSSFRAPSQLR